jgi:hypothetical protein
MFGMLDYRAYKLFWLVGLPLRLISRLCFFVIVAIAIMIGRWTEYVPLVQIIVAYAAMELIALIFALLWLALITLPVDKAFFWLIDVIPSRGEDVYEAKEIARKGPVIWLMKKLMNDVDNWTFEDTEAFVSIMNWRARLFFDERSRFLKRVKVLQEVHYDTGKEPSSLGEVEIRKLLKPYQMNWFQRVIANEQGFNSIVGALIIIVVIGNWPH